ncbi:hypothetical protein D3C87_80550 [compost metagenome]
MRYFSRNSITKELIKKFKWIEKVDIIFIQPGIVRINVHCDALIFAIMSVDDCKPDEKSVRDFIDEITPVGATIKLSFY